MSSNMASKFCLISQYDLGISCFTQSQKPGTLRLEVIKNKFSKKTIKIKLHDIAWFMLYWTNANKTVF